MLPRLGSPRLRSRYLELPDARRTCPRSILGQMQGRMFDLPLGETTQEKVSYACRGPAACNPLLASVHIVSPTCSVPS